MKLLKSILCVLALGIAANAQSPTPTPTPAPVVPHVTAMATVTEILAPSAVAGVIATIPASITLPDGSVLTLRGYQVMVSGTMERLMIQYAK